MSQSPFVQSALSGVIIMGLVVGALALVGLITFAPEDSATADTHDHTDHDHTSHSHTDSTGSDEGMHNHAPVELSPDDPLPSVNMTVHRDPVSGLNIQLALENFRFAAQQAGLEHVPGEGHAHIYVDGVKRSRIYGEWYHLDGLTPGVHEIEVTLNANNHAPLVVDGNPIADVAVVEISE